MHLKQLIRPLLHPCNPLLQTSVWLLFSYNINKYLWQKNMTTNRRLMKKKVYCNFEKRKTKKSGEDRSG
jgi:hypothetical protein